MSDVPAVRVLTSPSSAPLMESPRLCSFLSTFQLGLPKVSRRTMLRPRALCDECMDILLSLASSEAPLSGHW